MIVRKTRAELERCGAAGCWFTRSCRRWAAMVEEGISTWDLEVAAVKMMADAGRSRRSRITSCRPRVNGIDTCCAPR